MGRLHLLGARSKRYVKPSKLTLRPLIVRITVSDVAHELGSKVEVVYDPIESLQRGQVTEIPAHKSFYTFIPKEQLQPILAVFGLWFDSGLFNIVPTENSMDLNKIFPEIKPLKIQSMLRQKFQTTV